MKYNNNSQSALSITGIPVVALVTIGWNQKWQWMGRKTSQFRKVILENCQEF